MKMRLLGGILLIIGTSIGGGMLALPMATAAGGYWHSFWLFLGVWFLTMIAAYYILEVNLALPRNTNMISMARATLGPWGQGLTWLFYLLLLYALLSAYMAGGADLFQNLFHLLSIPLMHWLGAVLFVVLLGAFVIRGIKIVDVANRTLMSVKLLAFVLLVILIVPHIHPVNFHVGSFHALAPAVMVVVTSYGYSIIIPSLRSYFRDDIRLCRIAIGVGSTIPLVVYLIWDAAVQGSLHSLGANGLVAMSQSNNAVSQLTIALSTRLHSLWVANFAHLFSYVCITTSFLAVSLSLTDFLADGFNVVKEGAYRWLIATVTFLPSLIIVIFFPGVFIKALAYAGVCVVFILLLMPSLMVYSSRYVKKQASPFRCVGGRSLVVLHILLSAGLFIFGFFHL